MDIDRIFLDSAVPAAPLTQSLEGTLEQDQLALVHGADLRMLKQFLGVHRGAVVRPIRNEGLVAAFLIERDELQARLGNAHAGARPVICFHGTRKAIVPLIEKDGLKVPGNGGVSHTTDSGWYGKGIYTSYDPNYAFGYAEAGRLIVCAALLGKTYNCTERMDGAPCMPGFDSHAAEGNQEFVLFKSSSLLPLWVIDTQPQKHVAPKVHTPPHKPKPTKKWNWKKK